MRHDVAPAAVCEGLVRIYWSPSGEVHALKGVDAVVPAGRLTAITGPSGSGKSSLLRILAAQDRPTAGRAEVAGHALTGLSAHRLRALRRKHIGYVFARPPQNLLPHLTGREHLAMAASFRGVARAEAVRHGEELLDLLGIADRAEHLPGQLSGGEQQRVAIARALVGEPTLLLADEPTGNLDTRSGAEVMSVLARLNAERGVAVVVVTHDPEVAAMARRRVAVRDGLVESDDSEASADDAPVPT